MHLLKCNRCIVPSIHVSYDTGCFCLWSQCWRLLTTKLGSRSHGMRFPQYVSSYGAVVHIYLSHDLTLLHGFFFRVVDPAHFESFYVLYNRSSLSGREIGAHRKGTRARTQPRCVRLMSPKIGGERKMPSIPHSWEEAAAQCRVSD